MKLDIKYCKTDPSDIKLSLESLKKVRKEFRLYARNGYLPNDEDLRSVDSKYHKGLVNLPVVLYWMITLLSVIIFSIYEFIHHKEIIPIPFGILITITIGIFCIIDLDLLVDSIAILVNRYNKKYRDNLNIDELVTEGATISSIKGDKYEANNQEIANIISKLDKSISYLDTLYFVSDMSNYIKDNKIRNLKIDVDDNKIRVKPKKIKKDLNKVVSIDIDGETTVYEFDNIELTLTVVDRSFKENLIDFTWVDGSYPEYIKYVQQLLLSEGKDANMIVDKSQDPNEPYDEDEYTDTIVVETSGIEIE